MNSFEKVKAFIVFLVTVMILGLLPTAAAAASFSDIDGHWAEEQIKAWLQKGLIKGYPDGTFRPDQPVTRAELAAFANRALGLYLVEEGAEEVFSDVPAGAWYFADVAAAVDFEYLSGYDDGTFRPNDTITRQEAAVMLAELMGETGKGGDGFVDEQDIAPWAMEAVEALQSAGIMVGYPGGTFRPQAPITRAETVVTIARAIAAAGMVEARPEGPAGTGKVEIVSVEPDRDLVPGEETEFTVVVDYEFAGSEAAILYIGFNIKDANWYRIVDEQVVQENAGRHTFKVKAVVKDWGDEANFRVYVNISEYPHSFAWSPMNKDIYDLQLIEGNTNTAE